MTDAAHTDAEFWNERYAKDGYLFGEAPNAFLARQKDRLPASGRALAVADGDGRNGVWLAQQGLDVLSVDYSAVALSKAEKLAAARGVSIETLETSLYDWHWPADTFDVVAAIFFQFADPDRRTLIFNGIRNTLKPGGLLLLEGYRPEQVDYGTGGPPHRENMYTADLLRRHFGDWRIELLSAYDAEVDEGAGHAGLSALIDLVAVKPA